MQNSSGSSIKAPALSRVPYFLFQSSQEYRNTLRPCVLPFLDRRQHTELSACRCSHHFLITFFFFGQEYQNSDRYELAYDLLERTRDSEANLRSGAMVDAGDLFYYGRVNRSLDTGSGVIPLTSNAQMALSLYKEAAEGNFLFPFFVFSFLFVGLAL